MKHLTSSPSPETKLRKPWWSLSSSCWHYVTAHTQLHARCGKDQGTPRNSATMGPAPSPLKGHASFPGLCQYRHGCWTAGCTRQKSLVLLQHRMGSDPNSWKFWQVWKSFPQKPHKNQLNIKLSFPTKERKGKLVSPFLLIFNIPHQKKIFWHIYLKYFIPEIKQLLNTLITFYWGQILLSQIPTQFWWS